MKKNRNHFINGKRTPIMTGDQYMHRIFDKGNVEWINPNPESKFPIKMYFPEVDCYTFFNVYGRSKITTKGVLVDFPIIPEPPKPTFYFGEVADTMMKPFIDKITVIGKWDIRFMELACHISKWSKDPSTKVGAVIIDEKHRIVSVGFNGYPQNIPDDDLHDRERKIAKIIHGEMNAILFAQRDLTNCEIFIHPMAPCSQCASAIIQSGITRVVTKKATEELYERWGDKIKLTEEMFENADVSLEYI